MNKIKAVLVDDRKSHLNFVKKQLLVRYNEIEIIGEFTNPKEAEKKIPELRPDVLFLDIDMRVMNGIELAKSVSHICNNVVFLSNYMEYAPDTFQANALFLIDKLRMEEFLPEAIKRIRNRMNPEGEPNLLNDNGMLGDTKCSLRRIGLIGNRKVLLIIDLATNETVIEIKLSAENYFTLSKFILYKLVAERLSDPGKERISQKQDAKVFTNLSQSKAHFLKDVNEQLAATNIVLQQEDFFKAVGNGYYTFALHSSEIDLPKRQEEIEYWLSGYINRVLEIKDFNIDCTVKNGLLIITQKVS
jgi:DNA-binding LytR/AlgR family response regulator